MRCWTHLKARLRQRPGCGADRPQWLTWSRQDDLSGGPGARRGDQAQFQGGILWAGLGPQPNVLAHLSRWGTLLGTPGHCGLQADQPGGLDAHPARAIGERRLLLVVDDAWQIEAALAFRVGGPRCASLVTTRFPQIAVQFAGEGVQVVREFSAEESLTLLERLAPQTAASEPEAAQALVRASGGLPLAVTLMGKYLRAEAHGGQPRRIRAALERLRDARTRLELSEAQPLVERSPTLALHTPLSLQSVIGISDQQLEEPGPARRCGRWRCFRPSPTPSRKRPPWRSARRRSRCWTSSPMQGCWRVPGAGATRCTRLSGTMPGCV